MYTKDRKISLKHIILCLKKTPRYHILSYCPLTPQKKTNILQSFQNGAWLKVNFSLQKYLNKCEGHILKETFYFKERKFHDLNQQIMI